MNDESASLLGWLRGILHNGTLEVLFSEITRNASKVSYVEM